MRPPYVFGYNRSHALYASNWCLNMQLIFKLFCMNMVKFSIYCRKTASLPRTTDIEESEIITKDEVNNNTKRRQSTHGTNLDVESTKSSSQEKRYMYLYCQGCHSQENTWNGHQNQYFHE